jgi:hypothetical protein
MLAVSVGVLLTFATGWLDRTLPRWFAAVGAAYLVLLFVVPPGVPPGRWNSASTW